MRDRLLIAALTGLPWALDFTVLQSLAAVIQRHAVGESIDAEAIAAIVADRDNRLQRQQERRDPDGRENASQNAARGDESVGGGAYQLVGSVAVIGVNGVIARRSSQVNQASQPRGTSVEQIQSAMRDARGNPNVRSILLRVDSPGGNVDGIQGLASEIRAQRGQPGAKPVWASIEGMGASAAYWIAAQSNRVNIEQDAHAGSIGVYSAVVDSSAKADKEGIKVHLISSGGVKGAGMPGVPVSEAALAHYQGLVDTHYANFLGDVAAGRGLSMEQARALGDGRIWVGPQAKSAGLADTVGTTESVVAEMNRRFGEAGKGSGQFAVGSGGGTEHKAQSTEHDHAGRVIVAQNEMNATGAAATGMVPVADVAAQGSTDMRTLALIGAMGIAGLNLRPDGETGGIGAAAGGDGAPPVAQLGANQAATRIPTAAEIAAAMLALATGQPTANANAATPAPNQPALALVRPPEPDANAVAEANMTRVNSIRAMARGFGDVDGMAALVDAAVADTRMSADQFGRKASALVAQQQSPVGQVQVAIGTQQWDRERAALGVYLFGRMRGDLLRSESDPQAVAAQERAARGAGFASLADFQKQHQAMEASGLRRMRLIDIAEASVNRRINGRRHASEEMVMDAAFGTTSGDFSTLFKDVNQRTLISYFEETPVTWRDWCGVASARDFRTQEFASLSESGDLKEIVGNGNPKEDRPSDRSETAKLKTYGKKISVDRRLIINDDLGALQRWLANNGAAAARLPEQKAIGVITANANMSDGKALFSSDHNNLAGSGGALSQTLVETAMSKMMTQRGFGPDAAPLMIMPRVLLTPIALWGTAQRICLNPTDVNSGAANANIRNVVAGKLVPVASPYLDINSATAWYLIGDKTTPLVVLIFLNGNQNPIVTAVGNGSILGFEQEMIFDVEAKSVQFEAGYKNAGG